MAMAGREAAMVAAAADMTDSEVALRARAVGLRAEVARAGGMRAVETAAVVRETAGVVLKGVAQRAAAVRAAAEGAVAEAAKRAAEGATRVVKMAAAAAAAAAAAVGKFSPAALVAGGQRSCRGGGRPCSCS